MRSPNISSLEAAALTSESADMLDLHSSCPIFRICVTSPPDVLEKGKARCLVDKHEGRKAVWTVESLKQFGVDMVGERASAWEELKLMAQQSTPSRLESRFNIYRPYSKSHEEVVGCFSYELRERFRCASFNTCRYAHQFRERYFTAQNHNSKPISRIRSSSSLNRGHAAELADV
jgi:hypothetical protein